MAAKKQEKKRVGRPPGRTHVEVFVVKAPKGTRTAWRKAAKREGLSVAEMVRRAVADRIAGGLGSRAGREAPLKAGAKATRGGGR